MISPEFTSTLQDISANPKSTIRLKCILNVNATVEWFKDGKLMKTANKGRQEHWLTIKNVSQIDCGEYVCRSTSAVTSCTVSIKSKFTKYPK